MGTVTAFSAMTSHHPTATALVGSSAGATLFFSFSFTGSIIGYIESHHALLVWGPRRRIARVEHGIGAGRSWKSGASTTTLRCSPRRALPPKVTNGLMRRRIAPT